MVCSRCKRLPSSRKLSIELGISRNTVNGAYEQLVAEGYVESKPGSGFYVSLELPGNFLPEMDTDCPIVQPLVSANRNASFDRGVPELKQFPMKTWHRLIQRHALRVSLLGSQDIQGCMALRLRYPNIFQQAAQLVVLPIISLSLLAPASTNDCSHECPI